MTVLIVDNSEVIRRRLVELIQDISGLEEIRTACTLEDSERDFACRTPDLLLLDIFLPDVNAIQTIKAFKRNFPKMQIAVLTNDVTAANRKKCIRAGVDWFFDKSIECEQVADVVRNLAKGGKRDNGS